MLYKVIEFFTDLQDEDFAYHIGDTYPREGKQVTAKRIRELSTKNNKRGKPLIKSMVTKADKE